MARGFSEHEQIFIQLVVHLGPARARKLVEVTAAALRRMRHNEREYPKLQRKRAARGPRLRKGFAAMDSMRVKAISSLGGKAAHAKGTAHEYSRREATRAGSKGGLQTAAARRFEKKERNRRVDRF